jgi:hypothetical protein
MATVYASGGLERQSIREWCSNSEAAGTAGVMPWKWN